MKRLFTFSKWKVILLVIVLGVAIVYSYYALICVAPQVGEPTAGSHGYRTWSGESLISFEHTGRRVCVPSGWEAIGETSGGSRWARFESGKTGVLIKTDEFDSRVFDSHVEELDSRGIRPANSKYFVTLLHPKGMSEDDVIQYAQFIFSIFSDLGVLFNDSGEMSREHTVLITYGLDSSGYVYPDPNARLTIAVRPIQDPRGRELIIHAVAHLYNRYVGANYGAQTPFTQGEFEELVATWSEIAYVDEVIRKNRVDYLYRVHAAVMSKNHSLVSGPPYQDREAFLAIRPTVMVPPGAPEIENQYGHYTLAPLVMMAVEGLLQESKSDVSVEDILMYIHTEPEINFLNELSKAIPSTEMEKLNRYIRGEQIIPWELVQKGVQVLNNP